MSAAKHTPGPIKVDLTTSDALNDAILTALFAGYGYRLESDLWNRPQVVRNRTNQPSNPANDNDDISGSGGSGFAIDDPVEVQS